MGKVKTPKFFAKFFCEGINSLNGKGKVGFQNEEELYDAVRKMYQFPKWER